MADFLTNLTIWIAWKFEDFAWWIHTLTLKRKVKRQLKNLERKFGVEIEVKSFTVEPKADE